jgi:cytochrome b561
MIEMEKYTKTARVLHWLTVLLVISQFASYWIIVSLAEAERDTEPFELMHGIGGITLLVVTLFRLFWRWRNPPPALLGVSSWQAGLARSVHLLLYALLIAQPVSGILAVREELDGSVHGTLSLVLLVVIAVHVGAALYHHFIAKDGLLRRMW